MNDPLLRAHFHRKVLRKQHNDADTVIVDELGLKHGQNRADIAVINGKLVGFEIKSNEDTLDRIHGQIVAYNSVFDRVSLVVGEKYADSARTILPNWWGIIVAIQGPRKGVKFETCRRSNYNPAVDSFSVAQLLWRNEAVEILKDITSDMKVLRSPKKVLYQHLVSQLHLNDLRDLVRDRLKKRKNWRVRGLQLPCGDLCQPYAKSKDCLSSHALSRNR